MSYLSNKIKRNFTTIPNQIFTDNRLSMGAKIVYCYLGSKPDGWKISNLEVQNSLNISSQTLSKYFKELLETGWIARQRITDEENKFAGGFNYELFNPFENPDIEKSHICKNSIYGKSMETYINKEDIIKKDRDNNKEKKEISKEKKEFEDFWAMYPKQRAGSKAKALVAYLKVLKEKRATEEHLLAKVKEYANSREVREGYAKGCAAWLNDDRFNSDYNGGGNNGIGKDYNRENTGEYSGLGRKIG